MFLQKEKRKEESLILMKIMTLGQLFVVSSSLAKASQLGWLTTPTNRAPSLSAELGMNLIVVQDSSWMKIISKLLLILRIVFIMKLFFLTFCGKIFRSFTTISCWHSHLNRLSSFWFFKV